MTFDTIREAANAWVDSFNAIPRGIIDKLLENNEFELTEVTPPSKHDRVCVTAGEHQWEYGEIVRCSSSGDTFIVEMDDGDKIKVERGDVEVQRDDWLPMWGTMWAFDDNIDNWWLEEDGGLQKMADCGFRIFEQEDFGYIFGIDGAGYSFMDEHFIPLYKARGLRWHKEEEVA